MKTIAIIIAALLAISAVPAAAQEADVEDMPASAAIFKCDGPVTLRFADSDGAEAVVSVNGGAKFVLPNTAFTGSALIYSHTANAKSCAEQAICVAGIFHDLSAVFDVFVDGVKHNCVADNWSGQ